MAAAGMQPVRPTPQARTGISAPIVFVIAALLLGAGAYVYVDLDGRLDKAKRDQTRLRRNLSQEVERVTELESSLALVTRTLGQIRARTIDVTSIIEAVQDAVFTVADPWSHAPLGTGFAAASDADFTYVATNHHVIDSIPLNGEVELQQDAQRWVGTVYSMDKEHDLALIQVQGDFDVLESVYAAGREPQQGEPVMALGSPYGLAESATVGIVSALRPETGEIQTDAPINFGNSGGPLLNAEGQVLGITSSFIGGATGLGFAIDFRQMCEVLIRGGGCG